MATIRVEHNSNYTVMANYYLRDKSLSLKAKGLLSYMLSLPDDWDYTIAGLSKSCKDGVDSIRTTIGELEAAGYIRRTRGRNEDGTFAGADYTVMEKPLQVNPTQENPIRENPIQVNPTQENPTQLDTNIPSTYGLSTNLPSVDDDTRAREETDNGLGRVMALYFDQIEPFPSHTSIEMLKGYVSRLGPDVCERAIERAIDAGARKWTYIHAILKNCEKDGIRSIADWEKKEAEYHGTDKRGRGNATDNRSADERWHLEAIEL